MRSRQKASCVFSRDYPRPAHIEDGCSLRRRAPSRPWLLRCARVNKLSALALAIALVCLAHEGGHKNLGPTRAQPDLNLSRAALEAAKRKLIAQGRYACCVKPSCSLCARVNGSCNCAANVQAGLGACGECLGGWKSGRGAIKGIDADSVKLLTADHQSCPRPGNPPDDLREAAEALLRAKRTLVAEKRFACCIRGGCGQCAHEGSCPCG